MHEIDESTGYEGFSRILLKQMMADGRDCWLSWKADFSHMEILLHVEFLSQVLLVNFLESLLRKDERFVKAGIPNLVEMSKRFNIKVIVTAASKEVGYKLFAYHSSMPHDHSGQTEIDLLPWDEKTAAPHNLPDTSRRIETGDVREETVAGLPQIPATIENQGACDHNWERDGQTMTAVRWTCTKCFKAELR